ncbi:O-methyltransferase [Aureibacter tunicatorum]|uniref:O-methyltransferase YrrM n=1 Tax=Aureibacter tunicatorum TaxID=866807 RepID=A0AAE3XN61_9BACT|nr:O-methyltransferase [Aureibacter tunicatorum]MDR6240032.1 putative O-methyltransferase YrrM [Aureibacter tunicatorum]BDD04504.1 O-methyltransferase [Aureibacter tunicatorum]
MEFIDPDLQAYCDNHTSDEPEALKQLDRDTHINVMMPRMLSGHFQGRLLKMLVRMIKPQRVLEIGTYTGYSAICMAEGLPSSDAKIVTIDINEELEDFVQTHLEKSGLNHQVECIIGNAMEIIPNLEEQFDLVFIDADKINYPNYLDLIIEKVDVGGYIIADNILWSGKVLEKNRKKLDKDTQAILDYNRIVQENPRLENVLLPVRDGLMIAEKIK